MILTGQGAAPGQINSPDNPDVELSTGDPKGLYCRSRLGKTGSNLGKTWGNPWGNLGAIKSFVTV